jgi:hypothetical protein
MMSAKPLKILVLNKFITFLLRSQYIYYARVR